MKVGSLFSGYGGLDLGLELALGNTETVWVSDIEPGPQEILKTRFPDVPNLGDITTADWQSVPDIDVIIGGSPCQDLSIAGRRAGMNPETRSGLWESMLEAIQIKQPDLVVWENVPGAYSAKAFCNMESKSGCVGDRANEPVLRALGRVLGDLASIGYNAGWTSVRASDVGAPHNRKRLFVVAHPTNKHPVIGKKKTTNIFSSQVNEESLFRTPCASEAEGGVLSPAEAKKRGKTLRLSGQVLDLLPTPESSNQDNRKTPGYDNNGNNFFQIIADNNWGKYILAIRHWERIFGRMAPSPVEKGTKGQPRLSSEFVEWMMGLPEGWVTDIPISRTRQMRALGNGVVPQQAALAITNIIYNLSKGAVSELFRSCS